MQWNKVVCSGLQQGCDLESGGLRLVVYPGPWGLFSVSNVGQSGSSP